MSSPKAFNLSLVALHSNKLAQGAQRRILEDRYHATAIETNHHLHRCIVYVDLNMVQAGVVSHSRPEMGVLSVDNSPF